jgi:glycosyltransferase involved in cell wall biosynthesis
VIAEAMAYGRPVIGTRVGGIPEVVTDHETGFLVERGDVRALARKVVALIDDPPQRTAMGIAGRQKVHTHFDLQKNVALLMKSYGVVQAASLTGHAR